MGSRFRRDRDDIQGGCIIRAQFLHRIKEAYDNDPDLANLMLTPYFRDILEKYRKTGAGRWPQP